MQNNLVFTNELVAFENFDKSTNTLTIKDVSNETIYITFDGYIPANFNIDVINSNVVIIENYKGDLPNCDFKINIDEHSRLNRLSILVDVSSSQQIKRDINNEGYYQSMQIDLTENSVSSEENINLNKQEAYALVIDGIYALKNAKKKYQTNLNHYVANCESKAQIFAINDDDAHGSIFTDAYIKNKAPQMFDYLFRNTKLKGATLSAAKGGFILLTTLVFAQIILKRVLTPFIATPMASYLKNYAYKSLKKDQQRPEAQQSPQPKHQNVTLNLISGNNNQTFKSFNQFLK